MQNDERGALPRDLCAEIQMLSYRSRVAPSLLFLGHVKVGDRSVFNFRREVYRL